MREATVTKPQIISAIKKAARRLRRTPTRSEFEKLSRIHRMKVQRLFGGYRVAVRAAGLEPDRIGVRIGAAAMLEDWGRVARKMKRHPTRDEYEKHGRYASASLETRFHCWSRVRERFLEFVEANGMEREWRDVVESLRSGPVPRRGGGKSWLKRTPLPQMNAENRRSEEENGTSGDRIIGPSGHRSIGPAGERHGRSGQSGQGGRSETEEQSSSIFLPQMNADERGFEERPVNPEILPPPVRGKRCVTRSMLWILFTDATPLKDTNPTPFKHRGTGETEERGASGDRVIGPPGDRIIGPSGREEQTADGTDRRDRAECYPSRPTTGRPGTPGAPESHVIGNTSLAAFQNPRLSEMNSTRLNLYFPKRVLPGRPLMGRPMHFMGMGHEPVNEMGVVFLFAMIAHQLGFVVDALQMGYPDCMAKLEVEPGIWQLVRIEFEYESRKFREHRHDPAQCDIIVCWRHNWKGCPEGIQVIELSKMFGRE
jgi:preprotein translocase subunit Sss1